MTTSTDTTRVVGFDLPSVAFDGPDGKPKGKKGNKKSGGFQSLGLSFEVLKGIQKRGYKVPTPIQRKVCKTFDNLICVTTFWSYLPGRQVTILLCCADNPNRFKWKRCGCYGPNRQWENSLFPYSHV